MSFHIQVEYPIQIDRQTLLDFVLVYFRKLIPQHVAIGTLLSENQQQSNNTWVYVETSLKFERGGFSKKSFMQFNDSIPTVHKQIKNFRQFRETFKDNMDQVLEYHSQKAPDPNEHQQQQQIEEYKTQNQELITQNLKHLEKIKQLEEYIE